MDRARSLPPGQGGQGPIEVATNPFWSKRLQDEIILRQKRPENLPIPTDDEDLEMETVQDMGTGHGMGSGRGVSTTTGGRMYVTPPSHGDPTGKGQVGLRRSEGVLPGEETTAPSKTSRQTMGPMPPKGVPTGPVKVHKASVRGDEEDGIQRALEAEMVTFLREQNEQLTEELARLRRQMTKVTKAAVGPTSTPSSWETVDGLSGDAQASMLGGEQTGAKSYYTKAAK